MNGEKYIPSPNTPETYQDKYQDKKDIKTDTTPPSHTNNSGADRIKEALNIKDD